MDWLITLLIIAPAVVMAFRNSTWLVDYAIIVVAFNRLIRRLVDFFIYQQFNSMSPISITPLAVACLICVPVVLNRQRLSPPVRQMALVLGLCLAYGLCIGILMNGMAAVFNLGEWLAGAGAMFFAASYIGSPNVADRWFKTAGWCGVAVAAYAWYQFLYFPDWDAFWLQELNEKLGVGWVSGAQQLSVFSTTGSRGTCGAFLGLAVLPMILNRRWSLPGRWVVVAFILSAIVLTTTRTMFIVVGLATLLQPMLTRGVGIWRVLAFAGVIVAGASFGISKMPEAERFEQRFSTLGAITEDSSFQGRAEIMQKGLGWMLAHPLGTGLGSTGGGSGKFGVADVMNDAGYIEMFAQFGWLGGLGFYYVLWLIWREYARRLSLSEGSTDPFLSAARAVLIASVVFLFVGDVFSNFSLLWVFFGRPLHPLSDPAVIKLLQRRHSQRQFAVIPAAVS